MYERIMFYSLFFACLFFLGFEANCLMLRDVVFYLTQRQKTRSSDGYVQATIHWQGFNMKWGKWYHMLPRNQTNSQGVFTKINNSTK